MIRYALSLLCVLCVGTSFSQTGFPSYYSTTDLSFVSPGALKTGLYGYNNPALIALQHQPDLFFTWSDAGGKWNDFNRWGLFTAFPHLSFGFIKTRVSGASVTDYQISLGFGDRTFSSGLAYGWAGGDRVAFGRTNWFRLGTLVRPSRHVSVGLVGTIATSGDGKEAVADLSIRPLGNELITVFGDYGIRNSLSLKNGLWSAGAAVEPLPGVRVTGRYFETKAFAVGMEFSLGRAGISSQATYGRGGRHAFTTYGIRLGAYDRNVLARLSKGSKYVQLNMLGPMKYQRFRLFDKSNTLAGFLNAIDAAQDDESVGGIAISTSGMNANREMLWEIREKLKEFRGTGKKVVVFLDRPSLDEYHFASVADKIVLDPTGLILLQGYVLGRTFLKGSLEKLGIGYDEWRFFRYKSANENLSRDAMSEADREQRQKLVDDFYRLARTDIAEGRSITPERFDQLVDEEILFMPAEALAKGLVDTLGRWDEAEQIVNRIAGQGVSMAGAGSLERFNLPHDNRWGERDRIAVIHAIGVCAMDEGIKARSLVKDVESAGKDPRVKAIVLRVDSPGGDGMASDYVAAALDRAKKKKPVIVSQGYVAASGGYWLSMYADTVVAAPTTITGSIGVIGGWMYNKGLKEKLGMTTDFVKAGEHADLGFGFRLPLLGVGIPDRNLDTNERKKVERAIRTFYSDFVTKVAAGRNMTYDAVDAIGEGRVWSGYDANENGLVDLLGGLDVAIRIAREKAGIPPDEEVDIVELPAPGLIDFSAFMPKLFGIEIAERRYDSFRHLMFLLKHNGQPMPVMPMEEIDFDWMEE